MPWLMDQVEDQLNRVVVGRAMLDQLIREVVKAREDAYAPAQPAAATPAAAEPTAATPAAPSPAAPAAEPAEQAPQTQVRSN